MLQKIIGIKNVGRFRNSAAQPNPTLKRHCFIYGPNGFGKTTLCASLRSFERNDPAYIVGRRSLGVDEAPAVGLLWNGVQRAFQAGAWPGPEEKLSIFDGTFVAENVHSGDIIDVVNRRNLYRVVVGRDGVGLAMSEARLTERGKGIQQQLAAAEKRLEPMTAGVTPTAFDKLPADPELTAKLADAKAALTAQQQSAQIQARAALAPLVVPELPPSLAAVLAKSLDGVDPAVERRVEEHLVQHHLGEAGEQWLAAGTRIAGEGDYCPFCARPGLAAQPVVMAFRALFGEAYAALRQEVDGLRHEASRQFGPGAFGELRATAIANVGAREFWSQHCASDADLPAVASVRDG